jgi:hypothetical protein
MASRSFKVIAALALVAAPLAAQSKPIELGFDAGVGFKVNDPTFFTASIPVQSLRVGFFLSDRVSIEPRILFDFAKEEGEDGAFQFGGELGIPFHFSADASRSRAYFVPFAGIEYFDFGPSSANQFHVGGGLGIKVPAKSDRLALRLEAGLQYGFENDDFDKATVVYGLIGFSFFTK